MKMHKNLERIINFYLSLSILIIISPLLIIVLLALILIDGRPVIYSQDRVGLSGKIFKLYKIRTMVRNADDIMNDWKKNNTLEYQNYIKNNFKLDNDPRISYLGSFLRRTSVDELPQLYNVLKGDMNIVGPRPLLPAEIETYGASIEIYKTVKPGLTGLWQISGRSNTTFQERIKLDTEYIYKRSHIIDAIIIAKTIKLVLKDKNAK